MDYRKIYEQHYNITLENDMVIHHIDLDRSNNDISNLLMLPRNLHSKYHMCLNALRRSGERTIISYDAKISGIVGILVKERAGQEWKPRYFAKYNGKVYAWTEGKTSNETEAYCTWNYAKLAEGDWIGEIVKK